MSSMIHRSKSQLQVTGVCDMTYADLFQLVLSCIMHPCHLYLTSGSTDYRTLLEKHKLPYQAVRYRDYMIMTNRVRLIVHMTLNGIRPDQVLSR